MLPDSGGYYYAIMWFVGGLQRRVDTICVLFFPDAEIHAVSVSGVYIFYERVELKDLTLGNHTRR